jgi:hypothetical protein
MFSVKGSIGYIFSWSMFSVEGRAISVGAYSVVRAISVAECSEVKVGQFQLQNVQW